MIKPTVGRMVHFFDHSQVEPMAAIVTSVHNDRLISISAFTRHGHQFSAIEVVLLQDDDAKPESEPFCCWMEYQRGQAQKTEALERELKESVPIKG